MKHKINRRNTAESVSELNDLHKSSTIHRLSSALSKCKPAPLAMSETSHSYHFQAVHPTTGEKTDLSRQSVTGDSHARNIADSYKDGKYKNKPHDIHVLKIPKSSGMHTLKPMYSTADKTKKSELAKSSKSLGNHMIFSMDNPKYGQHDPSAHERTLKILGALGADAQETQGKYGMPERSILIRNPNTRAKDFAMASAHASGQDSLIQSDGQTHKMIYLNGAHAGMHHAGSGTQYHQQEPADFYTKMADGTMFSHNFDMDKLHKAGVVSPHKNMTLKQMTNIKRDNNVGANGKDYSEEELNEGIIRAKVNLAAKMKLFPKDNGGNVNFPPPMPPKFGSTKKIELTPIKKADKPLSHLKSSASDIMAELKAHKERHAAMLEQKKNAPAAPVATSSVQQPIVADSKPTNSSQLDNLTAPVYVNIHQHRSAVRNYIPNPVSKIQHLDDVHKLNQYHNKDVVESVSNEPKPAWGHETYRVNPDKSMHLMDNNYDSSDSRTGRR